MINCTLVVSDSASAKSYDYQAIIVRPSANINFSDISFCLNLSLSKYFLLKDFSSIISAVNVVASTINYANCSGALNCTGLNRGVCLNTPHTCSACMTQHSGVTGADNSYCRPSSAYVIPVGGACTERTATDCLYFTCLNNTCVAPSKPCRSQYTDSVCSGHGSCYFYNKVTDRVIENCLVTDTYCVSLCNCTFGYGGEYCHLTPTDLISVSFARQKMCTAISQLIVYQDGSPDTLILQASSLSQAFDPFQLSSNGLLGACTDSLVSLAALSSDGYITGTNVGTPDTLADVISQFLNIKILSPDSYSHDVRSAIESAILGLQEGIHRDMVPGQQAVLIVNSNIQLKVLYPLVSSLHDSSLSPPALYGLPQSSLQLPEQGLDACELTNGYVQLSVMQYGVDIVSTGKQVSRPSLSTPMGFNHLPLQF